MCADNPGADRYRLYQDQKVFLVPTAAALTGMEDAVQRMARLVRKLAGGASIGPAAEEGYVPRGIRINQFVAQTGAERAIDMLLAKMSGSAFTTEVPVISMSRAKVAPRIADLKGKLLALATTMGVIPPGNPDRFKVYHNDHWTKYPIAGLNSMTEGRWDIIHGGYNTVWAVQNPNYSVPLDACRRLEKEQVLGQLYPFFYMTSGAMGIIPVMQEIGRGMARDMLAEGVDATILVSA
jgi:glycine reductase